MSVWKEKKEEWQRGTEEDDEGGHCTQRSYIRCILSQACS